MWLGRGARLGLGALAALPDATGLRFGAALVRAWVHVVAPRTRDARVNLRIAFPEWSDAEGESVLVASFENLGRSLVELAWIGRRDPALLAARVRVEGREHLELARAGSASGGVIVVSGHFGSWEMFAAAMSAQGLPITVVHRARDDGGLDEVVMERRPLGGAHYLPRGSAALGVIGPAAVYQLLGQAARVCRVGDVRCCFLPVAAHQTDIGIQAGLVRAVRRHRPAAPEADIADA